MMVFGAILLILGVLSAGYGYMQNTSMEAQLTSWVQSGKLDPGTIYIYIGLGVAVLGLLICVYAIARRGKR